MPTFVTLQHRSTCTAGLLVALGLHGRGRVARRPIDGPWGRGGIRGLALACSTTNQVGIAGTAGLPPPAAHRLVLAYLHHPATLQHFRCRCHCRCRCHSAALGWLRPTGWCRPRRPQCRQRLDRQQTLQAKHGNVGVSYKPTHGRPQHPPLHRRRAARHMKIRTRYTRHIDRMAARARNWGATTNRLRGAICRKAPKNACRGGAPVKHLAHPPIRFSSAGGAIQCLSKNTASNTRSVCWPTPLNGSPQR